MDDPKMLLAFNMRRLRRKFGWSQERLAVEADLHRTYVGALERGERNPSLASLQKVATALNVTVAELLQDQADS